MAINQVNRGGSRGKKRKKVLHGRRIRGNGCKSSLLLGSHWRQVRIQESESATYAFITHQLSLSLRTLFKVHETPTGSLFHSTQHRFSSLCWSLFPHSGYWPIGRRHTISEYFFFWIWEFALLISANQYILKKQIEVKAARWSTT